MRRASTRLGIRALRAKPLGSLSLGGGGASTRLDTRALRAEPLGSLSPERGRVLKPRLTPAASRLKESCRRRGGTGPDASRGDTK